MRIPDYHVTTVEPETANSRRDDSGVAAIASDEPGASSQTLVAPVGTLESPPTPPPPTALRSDATTSGAPRRVVRTALRTVAMRPASARLATRARRNRHATSKYAN